MKYILTLLTLFFASATALASIDPQDLTIQRDPTSGTLIVRTTVAVDQDAAFRVLDRRGNAVYNDSVRAGGFVNKRFPLTAFPPGSYTVELTDQMGATTWPLRPRGNGPVTDLAAAVRVTYPRIDLRDERTLVVDYANRDGKRVSIRIADAAGRTVFSDQVDGKVQRAYRLDQLALGDYRVVVDGRSLKTYTQDIALR